MAALEAGDAVGLSVGVAIAAGPLAVEGDAAMGAEFAVLGTWHNGFPGRLVPG